MKIILIFISQLMLVSCEINTYEALARNGNSVRETNWQLGGTRSSRRSDGSSYANDHQQSFRDGTVAATTIAGGIVNAANTASNNTLSATQNTNEAGVTNTTTKANAAIELGRQKPTILSEGQTAVFPK